MRRKASTPARLPHSPTANLSISSTSRLAGDTVSRSPAPRHHRATLPRPRRQPGRLPDLAGAARHGTGFETFDREVPRVDGGGFDHGTGRSCFQQIAPVSSRVAAPRFGNLARFAIALYRLSIALPPRSRTRRPNNKRHGCDGCADWASATP